MQEEVPMSNGIGKQEEDDFGGFTATGKKDKKKGKKGVFDALPEEDPAVIVVPEAETTNGDSWGGWGTASSKKEKDKKKGKKGVIEEVPVEEPTVVVVPEPETAADDSWGGSGSKKDKKKGKKDEQEPLPPPPPPPPPDPVAAAEGEWGTFGSKNKKKGKKGAVEQVSKVEEPVISVLPELDEDPIGYPEYEPEAASPAVPDTWGSFGNKKDKKKGKKDAMEGITKVEDPIAVVVPDVVPEPATTAADHAWGSATTKKDKKKGKKGAVDEISKLEEPLVVTVPEMETAGPAADDSWTSFGSKKDNKKKGKKGVFEEIPKVEDPPIVVVPDLAPTVMDDEWGMFGSKKDKKKGKNGAFEEHTELDDPGIVDVPEQESAVDIGWGGWGGASKTDKKSKKKGITEVVDVPLTVNEPAPAFEKGGAAVDDDWMNFGTGKKNDEKGRKGAVADSKADEFLPPPPPPPRMVPNPLEDSKSDDWASFGTSKQSKDKKGKKGKVSEATPVTLAPEPLVAAINEPDVTGVEDIWPTEGLSSKDKKKKEKDKAKRLGQDASIEVVDDPTAMPGTLPDAIVDLDAPAEADSWGIWGTGSKKDQKKAGKKSHVFEAPPPAPTPPAQGLTPEPTPPPFSALDDPEDCEWGTFAPVKTKGKKDIKKEPLIRTTSASKGATTEVTNPNKKGAGAKEPVDDFFDGLDDVDEDRSAAEVKKESPKEETPAKAVKGFWGSFGSTATSKTKTAKDKAKEKEEEKGKSEAQEQIKSDPVLEVVDRTDKKGSKIQKNGKLGKVESKGSDKSGKVDSPKSDDINALIDLMDGDPDLNDDELADLADSFDKKDDKKSDAWSFWGSSKKPTGKKADEPNQEIGKQTSTNQKASLGKPPKEPEPPIDDQPLFPPPPPATATAMNKSISAKSKVAGKLSVSEKIKALEKDKEEKAKPIPPPPPPEPEAPPKADTPPKKSNSLAKAKPVAASKGAATSKQKVLSPDPAKDKASKEAVPGSFPFEGADDDIIDVIDLGPIDKKASKKVKRGAEKAKMDPMIVDVPAPPSPPSPPTPPPEPAAVKPVKKERARVVRGETASSWGFWGAAPKKEVKKEKAVKDDVDGDSPPAKAKASPPGLVRSKSTKTGTGKETEKSSSKSSGSDKATKPEAKPSKSRGMSFSQLLMGSPSPARTMSTRRSSNAVPKTSSRRQSIDVGAVGLMSPPPDDKPEVPAKAAKIMGMGPGKIDRRPSTKGKQKLPGKGPSGYECRLRGSADASTGVVPDPYAIDDDDLVMVNGDYDAMVDVPIKASSSKKKGPESKAKKLVGLAPLGRSNPTPLAPTAVIPERPGQTWNYLEPLKANMNSKPKQFGGATTATDDIVMVEAGPSNDGPEVTTGSDDLAFVLPPREPAPLKRSMSSAKRPEKLMGLFGSFRKSRRASETFESPKTKAVYGTDDSKRLRREDRKVGRSGRGGNNAEDFGGDFLPGGGAFTEPEEQGATKHDRGSPRVSRDSPTKKAREADARAADERRARRREAEKAEEERRRAKAREARQNRVREEEEEEARRREEKKARRAARKDRHAGKTLANDETGNRDGEHRKRHRDKGLSSGAPSPMVDERSPRPRKTERRRSHIDKPVPRYDADEEADRRVRREARNTREGLNRRKSAPPVEDYFDPRNGSRGVRPNDVVPDVPVYNAPAPLPTHTDPYLNGANDHTSSWINSQIIEPPAFPPVEPTVIEPAPTGIGRKHDELDDDDQDVRREVRRAHRHSKYASVTPDGGDGHRRRKDSRRAERDGIRSSEGSEGDRYTRRKSDYAGYENGGPVRTFDGRLASAGPAKRGSWFKKFANL